MIPVASNSPSCFDLLSIVISRSKVAYARRAGPGVTGFPGIFLGVASSFSQEAESL